MIVQRTKLLSQAKLYKQLRQQQTNPSRSKTLFARCIVAASLKDYRIAGSHPDADAGDMWIVDNTPPLDSANTIAIVQQQATMAIATLL